MSKFKEQEQDGILNILGELNFYQRWLFLLLEGGLMGFTRLDRDFGKWNERNKKKGKIGRKGEGQLGEWEIDW